MLSSMVLVLFSPKKKVVNLPHFDGQPGKALNLSELSTWIMKETNLRQSKEAIKVAGIEDQQLH